MYQYVCEPMWKELIEDENKVELVKHISVV